MTSPKAFCAALICSFTLLGSTQNIQTPIVTLSSDSGLSRPELANVLRQPNDPESWRSRALTSTNLADAEFSGRSGYGIAAGGAQIRRLGRNLAREYLAALSDAKLETVFDEANGRGLLNLESLTVQHEIARAVVSRGELGYLFHDAIPLYLTTDFLLSQSFDGTIATADTLISGLSDSDHINRAVSIRGALSDPRSAAEFAALNDIHQIAAKFRAREVQTGYVMRLLNDYDRGNHDPLSNQPLEYQQVLSRFAYEMGRYDIHEDLKPIIDQAYGADPAHFAELAYWKGMMHYARNEVDVARDHFLEAALAVPNTKRAAHAEMRAAGMLAFKKDYMNAAAELSMVAGNLTYSDEIAQSALDSLDNLIRVMGARQQTANSLELQAVRLKATELRKQIALRIENGIGPAK